MAEASLWGSTEMDEGSCIGGAGFKREGILFELGVRCILNSTSNRFLPEIMMRGGDGSRRK